MPDLTLTGIYNVLEKLRSEEALNAKEKKIHDDGLVSVLKQIRDDLDQAVFHAYGWDDLWERQQVKNADNQSIEAELLERLVALNHQRAEEEKQGKIRWLRPEFQNPDGDPQQQGQLVVTASSKKKSLSKAKSAKLKWPAELPAQVAIIRQLSSEAPSANSPAELSTHFGRKSAAREEQVRQILETLEALGSL